MSLRDEGLMTYRYSSSLEVRNARTLPHVIFVEPWGEDYTLLPGEEVEIVAFSDSTVAKFHLVEWDEMSQVYCNEASSFQVLQAGSQLECGHNRQAENSEENG